MRTCDRFTSLDGLIAEPTNCFDPAPLLWVVTRHSEPLAGRRADAVIRPS
jgi:hypothetical protein